MKILNLWILPEKPYNILFVHENGNQKMYLHQGEEIVNEIIEKGRINTITEDGKICFTLEK